MKKYIDRLTKAIKCDRFNWRNYVCGGMWYGHYIEAQPLHCSYGQIGYTICIDNCIDVQYDWEMDEFIVEGDKED